MSNKVYKEEINDASDYVDDLSLEEKVEILDKRVTATLIVSIITLLISVILLFGVFSGTKSDSKNSGSGSNTTQEQTYSTDNFKVIKGTDIEKESKGKTIMIFIGRQNCGYCAAFAPVLEKAQKTYGFTAYYIDLYSIYNQNWTETNGQDQILDQESLNAITSLTGTGYALDGTSSLETFARDNFGATPEILFVKNNKLVGGIPGYVEEATLNEYLEKMGFSK
jgi:predicted bacteriocin transport accessory protein